MKIRLYELCLVSDCLSRGVLLLHDHLREDKGVVFCLCLIGEEELKKKIVIYVNYLSFFSCMHAVFPTATFFKFF